MLRSKASVEEIVYPTGVRIFVPLIIPMGPCIFDARLRNVSLKILQQLHVKEL